MEYLFLKRKKTTATSGRQKTLLFKAAERHWKKQFSDRESDGRKVDCDIYKGILYQLEIRQAFLDSKLSLKKLSEMIDTNQTYLSNVVNRYFGCNLKELVNRYRVEYAKELLCAGGCSLEVLPKRCGFASKSPFYVAFSKIVGVSPLRYLSQVQKKAESMTGKSDNLLIINSNMYNQF
ncbi:helix-turn-helix domain-containing protein [Phocaeicola sp.]|jgi:YesN/AraC family two-component response regulator